MALLSSSDTPPHQRFPFLAAKNHSPMGPKETQVKSPLSQRSDNLFSKPGGIKPSNCQLPLSNTIKKVSYEDPNAMVRISRLDFISISRIASQPIHSKLPSSKEMKHWPSHPIET